ncbi:lipase/acyltransferase domain-containing protein [Kibdelosporangium phytohabitans]|uniref:Uncharacterized protein n=1 Tax=Kibdelosporangium phytohabitans TaxID=860235 RepID=A0A0N9I4F2_9PSEU|nr:hypothetical protein [Kibdelosporangium phytohabitans]ALG10525.1 hypothetical protein AOZ06_29780 [Kibdelosporangium phytohabitans]MBE1461622.1 hypothetical protein [Kibdelosporangium phytohabitans]
MAAPDNRPAPQDAVVIVPGIMGSGLRDTTTGRVLWSTSDLRWYWRAWTRRDGLRGLALDEDELAGKAGRVEPAGLLAVPGWVPFLGGLGPYTPLVDAMRAAAADPAAVTTFPYDWRLPVEHNARLLADAMDDHLTRWRRNEAQAEARRRDPDGRPAQIVLVAHSMGGLLAQALSLIPGATADIRTTITIGTPFYGAVKAALILSTGKGTPVRLPREKLRDTARTMPGLHDLLPTYRCVHNGAEPGFLDAGTVHRIGGDKDLAGKSRAFHDRLDQRPLVGHHSVVGVAQQTAQGLEIRDGVVTAVHEAFGYRPDGSLVTRDMAGDGTVYWESAAFVEGHHEIAHQHGTLASAAEAISLVRALFLRPGGRPRPMLGAAALGMGVPDVVDANEQFDVRLTAIDAQVSVYELTGHRPADPVRVTGPAWHDGVPVARLSLERPGLYRIEAAGGSSSPISQTVLVDG